MNRNLRMNFFDTSMMEMRRKRDLRSLKRICDLCRELECAIISFNEGQEYSFTPLFRADRLVNNIWIIATIMADRAGETNDSENKQEKENNE